MILTSSSGSLDAYRPGDLVVVSGEPSRRVLSVGRYSATLISPNEQPIRWRLNLLAWHARRRFEPLRRCVVVARQRERLRLLSGHLWQIPSALSIFRPTAFELFDAEVIARAQRLREAEAELLGRIDDLKAVAEVAS